MIIKSSIGSVSKLSWLMHRAGGGEGRADAVKWDDDVEEDWKESLYCDDEDTGFPKMEVNVVMSASFKNMDCWAVPKNRTHLSIARVCSLFLV